MSDTRLSDNEVFFKLFELSIGTNPDRIELILRRVYKQQAEDCLGAGDAQGHTMWMKAYRKMVGG